MLLRWVINFQFLKAKTPSQANRLFVWALLRQLCDHKASEWTGIIMLLTLSTVICSQQKWKNNQIDLSMSHAPCTTIPVDRIREVVFSWAARPYHRQEDLSWVLFWNMACFFTAHAMKKDVWNRWTKEAQNSEELVIFRVWWRHCENILFHVQAFLTFNRSENRRF